MAESKSVVIASLISNAAIAVMKFVGFLLTGSAAMLSETYHSISDTGNQVFLLIGIRDSNKTASERHPFGYGKSQFFYSFLVSVLLFGIAGWESAKQGYHAIMHPAAEHAAETATIPYLGVSFPGIWVNYGVLIGAIVFEGWSLWKAYQEMQRHIEDNEWSGIVEGFRKTADVSTLTAFTENSVAVFGAGIALAGVYLSQATGNPIYDAASALLIGVLLMAFAVALALENKRLLIGEGLPDEAESQLYDVVVDAQGVAAVPDFRTVYFGPDRVLVTADVEFENGLETGEIDDRITAIEDALHEEDEDVGKVYLEPED
ncbi:MAG: cation diffusion facilitator family transporter [Haloarculaceae archaeon]